MLPLRRGTDFGAAPYGAGAKEQVRRVAFGSRPGPTIRLPTVWCLRLLDQSPTLTIRESAIAAQMAIRARESAEHSALAGGRLALNDVFVRTPTTRLSQPGPIRLPASAPNGRTGPCPGKTRVAP